MMCRAYLAFCAFSAALAALAVLAISNRILLALDEAQAAARERLSRDTEGDTGGWYEKRHWNQIPSDIPTTTTVTDAETAWLCRDSA